LRLIRTRPRQAAAVVRRFLDRDTLDFSRGNERITADWRECVANDLLTSLFLVFFLLPPLAAITVAELSGPVSLSLSLSFSLLRVMAKGLRSCKRDFYGHEDRTPAFTRCRLLP